MIDIGATEIYPSKNLSNFHPHFFILDGVPCASMEGFLQSLKFQGSDKQREICSLYGVQAKRKGSKKNKLWKSSQTLYWQDVAYSRNGNEYQKLLDRAFEALSLNEEFQKALLATDREELTHSIGKTDSTQTVLTIEEFCSRLTFIRERYVNSGLTVSNGAIFLLGNEGVSL